VTGTNARYPTMAKEPLHGLNRIGPRHDRTGRDAATLVDLLYTGSDWRESDDLLICTVEEAGNVSPIATGAMRPTCRQWFTIPELGLTVRLAFERSHLAEWRSMKEMAGARLADFALAAAP
jgi:hypothetical protein